MTLARRVRAVARGVAARLVDVAPFDLAVRALDAADRGTPDVLGVLTYHRVNDPSSVRGHPGLVSATPDQFAEQMAFLARTYSPIGLDDLLETQRGVRRLPRRAVHVTFDDAYRDFADHAVPVLRRLGVPATLFVPTAYPGRPERAFWWDWLHEAVTAAPAGARLPAPWDAAPLDGAESRLVVLRDLREALKARPHAELEAAVTSIATELGVPAPAGQVLSWDELRAVAGDGITLAPHSRTHPLLDRVDGDRLADELSGSLADLEREVGQAPPALAYPSGSSSAAVVAAARAAGYELGFTTRRGLNRIGRTDWLRLRRINVGRSASVNLLRVQLGRWALAWSR